MKKVTPTRVVKVDDLHPRGSNTMKVSEMPSLLYYIKVAFQDISIFVKVIQMMEVILWNLRQLIKY
ncbi:MAG: hypothetical protein WBA22_12365 [Candidatus Methanofastidiosia archaeon]